MALTAYCELDEVRAALGVNDIEISDAVLSLPVYEIGLVRELNKISVSLSVAFSTVSSISVESRTATEQALADSVHLFSVYAAAKQVGVSLGAMAPKDVGDGKATVSRFSDSPYKDVLSRIDLMYASTKSDLAASYLAYSGTSTSSTVTAVMFMASNRSYDPVTGS
jgi:hypothetical protein